MLHLAHERGGVPPSSLGGWAAVAAIALIAAVFLLSLDAGTARAQDPTPALLPPTDPRSDGQGPGFGSGPLLVATAVIGLGLVAALATLLYVRFLQRR